VEAPPPAVALRSGSAAAANGTLTGVSAFSHMRAWAVGSTMGAGETLQQTLALRLNSTGWSRVATPNVGGDQENRRGDSNELNAVSAVSGTDAWAVGEYTPYEAVQARGNGEARPLALHWNGRRWSDVATGLSSDRGIVLLSVSAASADDVWAVGERNGSYPEVLRWRGQTWTRVSLKAALGSSALYNTELSAVSASGSNSAWIVGSSAKGLTLTLRWTGRTWVREASPNPSVAPNGSTLRSVSDLGSSDGWAAGGPLGGGGASLASEPLLCHWDGKDWIPFASPPSLGFASYQALSMSSPSAGWAIGADSASPAGQLAVRWDGVSWTGVALPASAQASSARLNSVESVSTSAAWIVGQTTTPEGSDQPLVLLWNGATWSAERDAGAGL
jgi:hypothetical protein